MGNGGLAENCLRDTARFHGPQFLVYKGHLGRGWLEALAVVWKPEHKSTAASRFLGEGRPGGTRFVASRAIACSLAIHGLLIWAALRLPVGRFFGDSGMDVTQERVYEIKRIDLSAYLPAMRPKGPGGKPGRGSDPTREPAKGSTEKHPQWTLVSNPVLPDNSRQTIIQPDSPPELKIPFELRLPNILTATTAAPPTPKRPIRIEPLSVPRAAVKKEQPVAQAPPSIEAPASNFAMDLPPTTNPSPKLPVPPPSLTGSLRATEGRLAQTRTGTEAGAPGNGVGLLALSVDPAAMPDLISLPPGNRYGAFSISPSGGSLGSPGGVAQGSPNGGAGTGNGAGDSSTGVGPGNSGGGGGGKSGSGDFPISMEGTPREANPSLSGAIAPGAIFPVIVSIPQRRNGLIVSAGPTGGGGLRVYGVLRCGRIQTVYLAMPGKNWVMQYCLQEETPPSDTGESRHVVTRLQYNLIPPDAMEKFDFQRPTLPADKVQETIILHGVLDKTGNIQNVRIYQGVHPDADRMALAAFQRWKFRAPIRNGKAVGVEFLIGVPAAGAPAKAAGGQ